MTLEIGLVLAILTVAVVLFVSEKLRVDVVALLVLLAVALTGLVTPAEALSGFSNPAVVTVWAVFILSGGLTRTGVASRVGHQVMRLAGGSEMGLVVAIMLTAGGLSAFMNNVGVAALLLPVVMDITRRTGVPPSRLLIPLAFSSLLGGLVTMIGTPPNILISEAAESFGIRSFALFDYTPVGLAVMLAGVAYMALAGRHMLPSRDPARLVAAPEGEDLGRLYGLHQRLAVLRLPDRSALAGKSLAESRLGSALGVNVLAIVHDGRTRLAPSRETLLAAGDRLQVEGPLERLLELRGQEYLSFEEESRTLIQLVSPELAFREVALRSGSQLVGRTLRQIDFRGRCGGNVMAIRRGGEALRDNLASLALEAEDVLLVQGATAPCADDPDFVAAAEGETKAYGLEEQIMIVHVPESSSLLGKSLRQARLGDAFGLTVLGIARDGTEGLIASPEVSLEAGDILLVEGRPDDLETVQGLQELEIVSESLPELSELESESIGFAEVVLSPRTALAGLTLQEIHFRDKYGLNVLAVFREGEEIRTGLRNLPLRFGDALLLYGSRNRIKLLGSEPDFLVLTEEAQVPLRLAKAPLAAGVMAVVILPVIFGWLPIYLAAILGATLMILTRCLTMDEAYKYIEWRAVFLIAGMLPLGLAMQKSGAALFLTQGVVSAVGGFGPYAVVAALYMVTAFGAQVMPTAAVAILMAPIAFNTAQDLGLSPYALLMTVALSASASFMSPVAHPANVLIMGPGGYRFSDYVKVGLPLTLVCLVVVLLVLPFVWPLAPPAEETSMISMPGKSHSGPLPALNAEEELLQARLAGHVERLAGEIGERNVWRYEALEAAAAYVEAALAESGLAVASQEYDAGGHAVRNLEAVKVGSRQPDEIVVVGGHYDSVLGSPGANDNATGAAAVLELARLLADRELDRTVRFVAFVNEEPPFFQTRRMGSVRYARRAAEQREKIVAMLSLETIGCYTPAPRSQKYPFPFSFFYPDVGNFIGFVGNLRSAALVRRVVGSFRRHTQFPSEGLAAPGWIMGVGWSDHWSFWRQGYPAVMVTDTALFRYAPYHTAADTPEKIDYESTARVVAGLGRVVVELAST